MKIIIKETGKTEELCVRDQKTGAEYTNDLLLESGDQFGYIDEELVITTEQFEFWSAYICDLENDNDEEEELIKKYGIEAVEEMKSYEMDIVSTNYDEHHNARQRAFERVREEYSPIAGDE